MPKVVAAAVIVAALAVVVLFALPWLKVQRVEVEGASVVSRQQLLTDAGAALGSRARSSSTPRR